MLLVSPAVLIPFAALAGVMMQARALDGRPRGARAIRGAARARCARPRRRRDKRSRCGATRQGSPSTRPSRALLALIGGTLWWRRRAGGVIVTYLNGPTVGLPAGATLLEISRSFGIPHVSVCGGRARCSTCRVRVLEHSLPLPALGEAEARTLRAIGATPDIRLACQWRPSGEVMVRAWCSRSPARLSPRNARRTIRVSTPRQRSLRRYPRLHGVERTQARL